MSSSPIPGRGAERRQISCEQGGLRMSEGARREREERHTDARDVGVIVGLEDAVDALAEPEAAAAVERRRRRSLWAGLFWIPA